MTVLLDSRPKLARPRSPATYADSPLGSALRQPLLLGLFLPIQAGGWTGSTHPRATTWTFDYNLALAQQAEAFGFDLVFGLSQWLPKGGYNSVQDGTAIDSFITVAAMAAATQKIMLISTVHVLYGPWHPLHFAKFGATLDHISRGRWGVNVVTGHRAVEHEMFGWNRIDHDHRYELAREFVSVVEHLWQADENFSFTGERWNLKDAYVTPKPLFGRPIIVNATGSDAGIDFAARYSDIVFLSSPTGSEIETALAALPDHIARFKEAAKADGRRGENRLRALINPLIICRETDAEAWEYADAIVAGAVEGHPSRFDSDAHAWRERRVHDTAWQRALGGGNIQIIGSPATVARDIVRLYEAGVDGVQLSFYDFKPDLDMFGRKVLPLLREAGLHQ
jgi:dimethylsulfone monooxygenase